MCGRYTLTVDKDVLSERFGCPVIVPDYRPRYNAAPTQLLPVIREEQGQRKLNMMKWGLIPYWAKDHKLGSKLINARVETVADKPAFRDSFIKRRCIIPADSYYEWMKLGSDKQPMRIILESPGLFGFAGLWSHWTNSEGQVWFTFTILTTPAAGKVRHIHERMPFILKPEDESKWLQAEFDPSPAKAVAFLAGIKPLNSLVSYPVAKLINSPAHDCPELIEPAIQF